ncbi:MAG: hypothetical protein HQL41_13785, partial [Alphaproteobacteria bacterium]|nr:hypothetical protein [Alphaproteobacteria bacterium]
GRDRERAPDREPGRDRDRERGRRDRPDPRRRRRDEFGIGEMGHRDDVVGFGDHVPDFVLREVVLPEERKKRVPRDARSDAEADADLDDEIDDEGDDQAETETVIDAEADADE